MKKERKRSLSMKREIFLLSFFFLAIVSLIFLGVFLRILYRLNVESAENSLRECNSKIVTYTEGMFHENATTVELLSHDLALLHSRESSAEVPAVFDTVLQANKNITYIYAGYADGTIYISDYPVPENFNPANRPWYLAASETEGVARLVYCDAATGEWLFSQCKKLVDKEGNMIGAVSIDCSNESITNQLSARYQYKSQRSFIMNSEGTVVIHPDETYINDSMQSYMDRFVWENIISGKSNYGEYKINGADSMAYFERIPETDFIVATTIDAREVINPMVQNMLYLLALMAVISILLGLALSRVLIYRFARPVLALKSRIEQVAFGSIEEPSELSFSNVEIQEIANSIEMIVKDISRKEKQRKTAEYLSFHDSMTGLYNRRFFQEEQIRLDTRRNYPLCMICCDVNGLKLVNDLFGHDIGDQLIKRVARCIAKECRADDILARIGGDEFAVIMPKTPAAAAEKIIARIEKGLPEETIHGAEVSASFGFGVKEREEETLDDTIWMADKMMYSRKLAESAAMKKKTVNNIIKKAIEEGFVRELTKKETYLLEQLSNIFCQEDTELLKQGYRLRNIGCCSLFQNDISGRNTGKRLYAENGYRFLSMIDEYRSVAVYVLHVTEHWDGSGWPAGLSGWDIPLISRILAVADAYFKAGESVKELEQKRSWYDLEIVSALNRLQFPPEQEL